MGMKILKTVVFFNNLWRVDSILIWNCFVVFEKINIEFVKSECHFTMKSINIPNKTITMTLEEPLHSISYLVLKSPQSTCQLPSLGWPNLMYTLEVSSHSQNGSGIMAWNTSFIDVLGSLHSSPVRSNFLKI